MNFIEFQDKFPTEEKVIEYFIKIRYKESITCNHCGSKRVYQRHTNKKVFDCSDCHNTFSPFKDTIFEKTTTDLRKWMYAIHLFLNGRKGISGKQLQREVGVTYKTAWRMLHQIRKAMDVNSDLKFTDTIIEIDETYVGGKPRKENKKKDDNDKNDSGSNKTSGNKRGRGSNKTPVVGVKDRNNDNIKAEVMLPNEEGKKLTGKQLLEILNNHSKGNNTVISDEFKGYKILDRNKNILHLVVDHSKNYVDGIKHTNGMECFWSILKRGVYGIYHHISVKWMQNYVNEFCFRYNNRNNSGAFDLLVANSVMV